MPTARTKANRKWNEGNLDRVMFWVPKGDKDKLKLIAKEAGQSLNAFLIQAVAERIERDAQKSE